MKLFIFGSTGDLVKRKVLPALLELKKENLEIIALGRKDFTDEAYREFVGVSDKSISYQKVDFDNLEIPNRLLSKNEINYFYIALPPGNIKDIFLFLGILQKKFQIRVCVEKPFGGSLKEAEELKQIAIDQKLTDVLYLSDHYLFKRGILNLQPIEFKKLELVLLETVGLEGRVGYYDHIGAIKDIVQSHFLNIAFKLLKDPKKEFENFNAERDIRSFEVFQYGTYADELGRVSGTETEVSLVIDVGGREYEFRTAKKQKNRESYLEIDGKPYSLMNLENAYVNLFKDFFEEKRDHFATIENALLAWGIIEKLESRKPPVKIRSDN